MGLNGTLGSLVEEMESLLVQAEAEVTIRQLALDEAKRDAQRLRSILRAAGAAPEEPKAKAKPEPKAPHVSPVIREKVMAAIREWEDGGGSALPDVPGSFTAMDIKGDFHESSARTTILVLRGEGLVRAVGKKRTGVARSPVAFVRIGVDDV